MKISELWIYPVKSLGGIPRNEHEMLKTGLRWDRQWMVVDEEGKFLTQRTHAMMATVKMDLRGDQVWMQTGSSWGQLQGPSEDKRMVEVWSSRLRGAVDGNLALSEFLSDHLKQKVWLVTAAPGVQRPVPERESEVKAKTYFADSHPLLVTSEKTLEDLNTRLKVPVPMSRFRPNLVIRGVAEPSAEDGWEKIRAGALEIEMRKMCSRCPIITIDQETGVKTGAEPLATLAKYKRQGTKVYFGVRAWSENEGSIRVGDEVQILSSRSENSLE